MGRDTMTCRHEGCSNPRYKTYTMCEDHMKAYWNKQQKNKRKAKPTAVALTESGNTPPVQQSGWPRRYCQICRQRLPLAAFDTSRDKPAICLFHFVCRQCESVPEAPPPEPDPAPSQHRADFAPVKQGALVPTRLHVEPPLPRPPAPDNRIPNGEAFVLKRS